jgi:hypothetical protein
VLHIFSEVSSPSYALTWYLLPILQHRKQLQEGEKTYDMFSADVFNLGRTLQIEIQKARAVSIYYLAPLFFTVNVDFHLQENYRAVTTAYQKIPQYDSMLDLMTKEIPSERPTAATAYQLLMAII